MTAFIFFIAFIMWLVIFATIVALVESCLKLNNERVRAFINIIIFVFSVCATIDIIRIIFSI